VRPRQGSRVHDGASSRKDAAHNGIHGLPPD
jgi:hypothetical protein